jgi:hypothetical protein
MILPAQESLLDALVSLLEDPGHGAGCSADTAGSDK